MSDDSSTGKSLTKSDVIEELARDQDHLPHRDVEHAVKLLLEKMSQELASGERIEVRGFGSFNLHFRPARIGRNPKSGDAVALRGKYVPHFKPGKELRERVNSSVGLNDDGSIRSPGADSALLGSGGEAGVPSADDGAD